MGQGFCAKNGKIASRGFVLGKFILRAQLPVITRDVIGLDHDGFQVFHGDNGGDVVIGFEQADGDVITALPCVHGGVECATENLGQGGTGRLLRPGIGQAGSSWLICCCVGLFICGLDLDAFGGGRKARRNTQPSPSSPRSGDVGEADPHRGTVPCLLRRPEVHDIPAVAGAELVQRRV